MIQEHKHAILIIKKENKYLQYYDERWEGFLFLNLKITEDFGENKIIEYISSNLELNKNDITVKFLFNKIHTKFSESAKKEKTYNHYFYDIKLNKIEEDGNFIKKGIVYKWFTMQQLENDERIKKINSDIVSIVKNLENKI